MIRNTVPLMVVTAQLSKVLSKELVVGISTPVKWLLSKSLVLTLRVLTKLPSKDSTMDLIKKSLVPELDLLVSPPADKHQNLLVNLHRNSVPLDLVRLKNIVMTPVVKTEDVKTEHTLSED